jgi:hypothetical protein
VERLGDEPCQSFRGAVDHVLERHKEQGSGAEIDQQPLPIPFSARRDDQQDESDNTDARDSASGQLTV